MWVMISGIEWRELTGKVHLPTIRISAVFKIDDLTAPIACRGELKLSLWLWLGLDFWVGENPRYHTKDSEKK